LLKAESSKGSQRMLKFGFEDLEVWKKAVDFADDVLESVEKLNESPKHYKLISQLEAAAVSIALNISEGKGRYSRKEFIQFLYIARGSLYETVTLLRIFRRRSWLSPADCERLDLEAKEIARMIVGLIRSIKK
jgi:four helix bundle protein